MANYVILMWLIWNRCYVWCSHMTNEELVMNMLAELTTTNITKEEHPLTTSEHARVAERGGSVARVPSSATSTSWSRTLT